MKDWYKCLDSRFCKSKERTTNRDRVVVICDTCGKSSVVFVNNLKLQVRRKGIYECRSCASVAKWLKLKSK
jgi:hypothetical protein